MILISLSVLLDGKCTLNVIIVDDTVI